MTSSRRHAAGLTLGAALFATSASAEGPSAPLDLIPTGAVKLRVDGRLTEWGSTATPVRVAGKELGEKVGEVSLAYDDKLIWFGLEVADAELVRRPGGPVGDDVAELTIEFPKADGSTVTRTLELLPGLPGKLAGEVRVAGGPAVAESRLVERWDEGKLTIEASIPWAVFPEAKSTRVGLRGRVRYVDHSAAGTRVLSTAPEGPSLPPLAMAAEQSRREVLLTKLGVDRPVHRAFGNLAGDARLEEVAVFETQLTILGPGFRGGTEFFYTDLDAPVASLSLRDVDGDGLDEIFVTREVAVDGGRRDLLEVFKLGEDDAPRAIFTHEIAVVSDGGRVENRVSVDGAPGQVKITIADGSADGWTEATYDQPRQEGVPNVLLPWGPIARVTYQWKGSAFEKLEEVPRTGTTAPVTEAGAPVKAPPPPRPPTADELLGAVYDLYKKDRKVSDAARFDFVTDVAGDEGPERVVVHGREVVVFGKGFLEGRAYVFGTLGVADAADLLAVDAEDLTGDGQAELLVRALRRADAGGELEGEQVLRETLLVYRVGEDGVRRIFAAETGRSLGDKRVAASLRLRARAGATELELGPGRAFEWTRASYPFTEDRDPVGGLEPMPLPWSDTRRVYRFDGTAFRPR